MRLFIAIALFGLVQTSPILSDPTLLRGYGASASCAKWLSTRLHQSVGDAWLMGFWSGANYLGRRNSVGNSTDVSGVIAIAKMECEKDPSVKLAVVAMRLYDRFVSEGR